MKRVRFLLLPLLLATFSINASAQAIEFPADIVTLTSSSDGITLEGMRTPESTLPKLTLQATIPAVTDETVIVIGGHISDRPVKAPSVRTFIGHIGDDRHSTVTITYVGENLFGLIQHSDGTTWIVTRSLGDETYSVQSGADQFTLPDCGFRDEGSISDAKLSPVHPASTGLRELELAVETDSEFFKNTGENEQKAIDYLAALMSNVSSLYQKELGVVIKVVWARIWTNAPSDPYGVAGNPFALSDAVIANWKAYDTVERDLFHAITASGGGGGGYAFPDAICRTESHAHGATSVQGWTDLSAPGFNYDIYIVSHEIGHNFNARHTHSCYYGAPLDTCEVDQGIQEGCLKPGQAKLPNPGSIMSYCGWTNLGAGFGYTVEMGFRDTVRSAMQSYSATLECLSEVVLPVPSPVSPRGDTLEQRRVTFLWSETWTKSYEIEIAGDSNMSASSLSPDFDVTLPNGSYEWRVRSSTLGAASEWSEWNSFVVKEPLPVPVAIAPVGDTLTEGDIRFEWNSAWDGTTEWAIEGPLNASEVVEGRSHTASLTEGAYQWRLRSVSDQDAGQWSDWYSVFVVKEAVLPSVSILFPDGDTVGVGEVTLTWSSPWSGDYELEMRGDQILSETLSATSYTVELPAGGYEWRVRVVNGGETGPWSSWAVLVVSDDITGVEEEYSRIERLNLW